VISHLRLAWRRLRRQPAFAVVSVVILGLGLGATVGMFSLLNAVMFQPLPYPDSDRLVQIHRTVGTHNNWPHSVPNFLDHRAQNTVFEALAAVQARNFNLTEAGHSPERLRGATVTADFFSVLSVPPLIGRVPSPAEDEFGRNDVVVISAQLWRSRFGADPGILGRRLQLDGEPVTVVGVMSPVLDHRGLWGDVLRPAGFSPTLRSNESRGNNFLRVVARLKPGIDLSRAQAEMSLIAARLDSQHPNNGGLRLVELNRALTDATNGNVLWMAMGLAVIVLLITCINLAGVQLARLAGRAQEHAIRTALGAGRKDILAQTFADSLVVAAAGGVLGVLLAYACTDVVGRQIVYAGRSGLDVRPDGSVLLFALGLTLFAAAAVGTIPAWLTPRTDPHQTLKNAGRGSDRAPNRLRQGLVVAEMVLALVMLTAGGLFLRGLHRFAVRDSGWKTEGLVTAQLSLRGPQYVDEAARRVFFDRLQARLAAQPALGLSAISWSTGIRGFSANGDFWVEGPPAPRPGQAPLRDLEGISPGYFATLGIPILQGRAFTSADRPEAGKVVIVNEAFARRYWPDGSAIGKRINNGASNDDWHTIVGVAGDVRFPGSLTQPVTRFQVYRPLVIEPRSYAAITVRAQAGPSETISMLRQAVAELDPGLPLYETGTVRAAIDRELANFGLIGWILFVFALLGLLLAGLGVYGLFSGFVVERTREIGVRVALGARSGQIVRLVLGKGLRLAVIGSTIGLAGAFAIARLLAAAVSELPDHEPMIVFGLTVTLCAVALFACWLPARRAAALDPKVALRRD
jgi:putative ABC transport system permease protein